MSGLDIGLVSASLGNIKERVEQAKENTAEHLTKNSGYVAWSGGRDSTCVVDMARGIFPEVPVVWFDSGLEFPDNEKYILALAEEWKLNFYRIRAVPDALSILKQTGSWDHDAEFGLNIPDMHEKLIGEPARKAHEMFGQGELTGMRAGEAAGRKALLAPRKGHYSRKDGTHVCAPIWSWQLREVESYFAFNNIAPNPVYARLAAVGAPLRAQRVGLVVDGNNPENGRYTYLRAAYPDLWETLCRELPRLREWR